jgi:hypothetical protein
MKPEFLWRIFKGKRPHEDLNIDGNIKMQGRIYFDEGTDQWRILVNTVRKFGFRKKQGIS